jgi:hypothetical protein
VLAKVRRRPVKKGAARPGHGANLAAPITRSEERCGSARGMKTRPRFRFYETYGAPARKFVGHRRARDSRSNDYEIVHNSVPLTIHERRGM